MTFNSSKSFADNFIALAASSIFFGSLHKIVAHPSGEITEYIAFSNIITLFDDAKAIAPPEPPSPIMIASVGTLSSIQHSIDFAIASACPLSSAPTPGYAPGVSIKDIIGILNLFAKFINRIVFLYPSGLIIPKFLSILLSKFSPFS